MMYNSLGYSDEFSQFAPSALRLWRRGMEVLILAGDDRGMRAVGDLLNDLSFASVLPLDFSVAFTMFDTLVVPCLSSFGLGGHVADRLLPLLGPNFGSQLQSEIDNRFAGEQPKGSAFILETSSDKVQHLVWTCVSPFFEKSTPDSLSVYTAVRAACLAVLAWNQKASSPVKVVAIPLLGEQSGLDIIQEVLQVITAVRSVLGIRKPRPLGPPDVQRRLKELFDRPVRNFQSILESGELSHRGIASELELNALISFVREHERYPNAAIAAAEALALAIREKKSANGPDCPEVQRRVCNKESGCWAQLLALVKSGKAKVHEEADAAELSIYEDAGKHDSARVHGTYKGQAVTVRRFLLSSQVVPDPAMLDALTKDFRTQLAYFSVLRHPNLLPLVATFTAYESAMVFRFCPRTLLDVVMDTSLPVDAVRVGLSVASVLSFLHSVDVVHRDLKASSFVVGDQLEDVFLADFGFDSHNRNRIAAHTPPEVAEKPTEPGVRTAASDVYNLGVILWELSVRREVTAADLLAAAKDRNPGVRDVPGDLGRLVRSCWEARPSKRPTAAILHKELVRLVGIQPPPQTAVAIDERRAADKDTVQQMMQESDFNGLRAIITRLDPAISNNAQSGDTFDSLASLLEHYEVAVPLLTILMEKEIEKTDSIAMCLRGDSPTIVLLSRYFTYIGGAFLDRTLKPALTSLLEVQTLIDPRPLGGEPNPGQESSLSPEGSRTILKGLARSLFESLVRNAEVLPSPIHAVVKNLYAILLKRWPAPNVEEEKKRATVAVTSTLFLRFITPSVLDPPNTVLNKSQLKPRPRANLLTFAKYVQTLIGAREDPEKTFNFSIKDLYHPYCEALVATTPRPWVAIRLKPEKLQTAVTDVCNVVRNPPKIGAIKAPSRGSADAQLVNVPTKALPPPPQTSSSSSSLVSAASSIAKSIRLPTGSSEPAAAEKPPPLATSSSTPTLVLNPSSPTPLPRQASTLAFTDAFVALTAPSSPGGPGLSTSVGMPRRGNTAMESALARVLSVLEPAFSGINVAGKTLRVFDERWMLLSARSISCDLHKQLMSADKDREAAFRFSFDLGHALGRTDARALRPRIAPSTLAERYALGLALPAFTGLLTLSLHPDSTISDDQTFVLSCSSATSAEATLFHERFRQYNPTQGVCQLTMGFITGWAEETSGLQLATTEYMCRARGDEVCRFLVAPPAVMDEKLRIFSKGNAPNVPVLKSSNHSLRRAETPRGHRRNTSTASAPPSPDVTSGTPPKSEGKDPKEKGGGWLLSKVPFPLKLGKSEESESAARMAAVSKKIKGGMPARTEEQVRTHIKTIVQQMSRDPAHAKLDIENEKYVAFRATSLSYDFFSLMQQLSGREGEAARARSHNYAAHFVFTLGRALGRSHQSSLTKTLKLSDHPIEQMSGMSAFMTVAGFAVVGASHILNAQAAHPDGVVFVVECTQSAEAEAWKQSGANTLVLSGGVCALCCGFIVGWVHKAFELTMSVVELTCVALGDAHCTILLADENSIERVTKQHLTELGLSARANRLRTFPLTADMSI